MEFPDLPGRLTRVRETVARHQAVAGWTHPVTIIAVTKGHGPEAVRAAQAAGLEDVGENRVQEALAKQERLQDVSLAWQLARELGVRFLTGSITAQILREAQLSGLGDRHTASQIIPMERLAGVEVKERPAPPPS